MGIFAEQLIYGTSSMVILRSRSDESVRVAITDLVPNKPAVSVAMAVVPGGSLAYAVLPDKYNNIGSASVEAELLDSVTGERLAAALDTRAGKKTELFKGIETWGHAKKAFAVWAKAFREWLDQVHGKGEQVSR